MTSPHPTPSPEDRVAADPTLFAQLPEGERKEVCSWLRDRFFALSARRPTQADETFMAVVDAVDTPPVTQVEGLSLSPHPSRRFKAVRFIDAARIDAELRPSFARPSADVPHLCAVFVDPAELSFRTFENIVPLDRVFARTPLDISLTHRKKLGNTSDRFAFSMELSDATRATLEGLDALELYVPPLNAVSRGGLRFIFHSALLSEALTDAVKRAFPRALLRRFSHVNPVFRCNRFEPGDDDFHSHVDTPYFDAARHHVSRYTLILYLTGGRGAPALRIDDDVALDAIAPLTCVIFDQRYEHAGAPFDDARKVFLRTELVFEEPDVEHVPTIAELFSKACYLTGESVFAPELARHADAYYNRVAEAHFGASLASEDATEPFVHKTWRGVHFVTNGYDFWFPKGPLSLEECAAITLLDYFNCTIDGAPFRALSTAEVVHQPAKDTAFISELLARFAPDADDEPVFCELDKEGLFPPPEEPGGQCCPFHAMGQRFEATRCGDIVDFFARAQSFARERVLAAPVMMMGQEVFLDKERFVVEPGRIHVLSKDALRPVNFAACWNAGGSPENYVDVAASLDVLQPLVPPILYTETATTRHLMFDFFRNSWMVKERRYVVPVPRIGQIDPGDADENGETPWMDAVDRSALDPNAPASGGEEPWWGDDDPLTRVLFARR